MSLIRRLFSHSQLLPLCCLYGLTCAIPAPPPLFAASSGVDWGTPDFNWTDLTPLQDLEFRQCYESFECARLEVPLDWTDAFDPNKALLAVIRVSSVVSRDDPSYGGTVLINPGGPSGSGIDEIRWQGYGLRDLIDSDKHFDILSWDPRGVQHTSPSISCFGDDWRRKVWSFANWAVGTLDSSTNALDVKWAASEGFGRLCGESRIGAYANHGTNARQFVSTASTARDMIAIIDALDRAQSDVSERCSSLPCSDDGLLNMNDDTRDAKTNGGRHRRARGPHRRPALLNYWGYSYGTYLGNTFASMFPHRIGRMILDGNVDADDYTTTGWLSNLQDNNQTLHRFSASCFDARDKCPLYDENASNWEAVEEKMWTLLARLKHDPIPVVHDGTSNLVTDADVAELVHGVAYAPHYHWTLLAEVVADLLRGDARSMLPHLKSLPLPQNPASGKSVYSPASHLPHRSSPCSTSNSSVPYNNFTQPYPPGYAGNIESSRAILCGDGDPLTSTSKAEWRSRLDVLTSQSPVAGPLWAEIPFLCTHWPAALRPAERNRFTGPFASKLRDYDDRASPLLFVGNSADPVTPVRNAFKSSLAHEGSRVLTQNSSGHCSGYVNPSRNCTWVVVKRFFAHGELPADGTVCQGDEVDWKRWA